MYACSSRFNIQNYIWLLIISILNTEDIVINKKLLFLFKVDALKCEFDLKKSNILE